MIDPAEQTPQPTILAQQAPRPPTPAKAVSINLAPGRYRILEHQGRGAYRPAEGRFAVLDYEHDELARDVLNQYAFRIRDSRPDVSEAIFRALFDTDLDFQAYRRDLLAQGQGDGGTGTGA